ncbi:MAG: 4Fe-4S dicluster domain-containing protein [Thermoplasmata archaeon]
MAILDVWTPSRLTSDALREVLEFKDSMKLQECVQCGTCSASCPVAAIADFTPRQVIQLLNLGLVDEAVRSRMVFLCTNCFACSARCPRSIPVADVMIGLRNIAFSRGLAPLKSLAYYGEFSDIILKRGRLNEPELVLRYGFKADLTALTSQRGAIVALLLKGKLPIIPPRSGVDLSEIRKRITGGR